MLRPHLKHALKLNMTMDQAESYFGLFTKQFEQYWRIHCWLDEKISGAFGDEQDRFYFRFGREAYYRKIAKTRALLKQL